MRKIRYILAAVLVSFSCIIIPSSTAFAAFNKDLIMDDEVFEDYTSMSATSIDSWLNGFPSSCISPNSGFRTPDPQGWSSSQNKYLFGGNVTAGQAIYSAAVLYHVNPQVILSTLQKEQSIPNGGVGCHPNTPDPTAPFSATPGPNNTFTCTIRNSPQLCTYACVYSGGCMNIALGYGCPGYCAAKDEGFSMQITLGTWLLRFAQQRSLGNLTGYAGYETGDEYFNYSGPMTPGMRKRSATSTLTYYDGSYTTVNGVGVTIGSGATASLYNFTPFTTGNQSFVNIFENWFGSTSSCNYATGQTPPAKNNYANPTAALPGNWMGPGRQGYLYATPNSSGGFNAAVMASTTSGLQWQGIWWDQTNKYINPGNTVFIPGDADGDGYTDLYYATSINWDRPGFSVGLMHNNAGHGFSYAGTQWAPTSLSMANTRFLPGDWTGSGKKSFAYATPNSSGGFSVAVMASTTSGLQWQGIWWDQTNKYINLGNTRFIPADANGDGKSDLYYAAPILMQGAGFSMSLMQSNGTGLTWQGQQWNNSSLSLASMKFMPGNWKGGSRQGFAYTTKCGNKGFDLAVMASTTSGLQWQGTWWKAPTLPYTSTALTPADADDDGYTDLFYATPSSGTGFTQALQHTNNSGGFAWQGPKWSPSNLNLTTTLFLP